MISPPVNTSTVELFTEPRVSHYSSIILSIKKGCSVFTDHPLFMALFFNVVVYSSKSKIGFCTFKGFVASTVRKLN